jgi:hypothetical protein
MKTYRLHKSLIAAALVAACLPALRAGDAPAEATALTNAAPVVAIPRATFVDDLRTGKDPFFPNSVRRYETVTQVATNAVPAVQRGPSLATQLALKGISGTRQQPLALINSATVAVGETAEIKCSSGQTVKVLCREIRERSVLIELVGKGEVKELKLREGI